MRSVKESDWADMRALWNRVCAETVLAPLMDDEVFRESIGVMDEAGFALGRRTETQNDLTAVMVRPELRGRGRGRALLHALKEKMGPGSLWVTDNNPTQLTWYIPGTPGHTHNKLPGVDEDSAYFGFLRAMGFESRGRVAGMYLNLAGYESRRIVPIAGIEIGRYDPARGLDFDRMCDGVGSEYWRGVLRAETEKKQPRVILAAIADGRIVGFTGPVDLEKTGRGWFSGICVDPEYRGRGVATALFSLLMDEFKAEDASFSSLYTGVNGTARRIYEGFGFRAVKTFHVMENRED